MSNYDTFATEADAEAWIAEHQRRFQSSVGPEHDPGNWVRTRLAAGRKPDSNRRVVMPRMDFC
jgi:hypothetical protein